MQKFDAIDAASLRSDIPELPRRRHASRSTSRSSRAPAPRVQVFQGIVIRRHGGGIGETFTVRKISFGVGVERTFPLHTPDHRHIELVTPR